VQVVWWCQLAWQRFLSFALWAWYFVLLPLHHCPQSRFTPSAGAFAVSFCVYLNESLELSLPLMDLFLVLAAFAVSSLRFSLFFCCLFCLSLEKVSWLNRIHVLFVREREAFCVKDRWEIDVHEFLTVE
jgi:hypothetical protein